MTTTNTLIQPRLLSTKRFSIQKRPSLEHKTSPRFCPGEVMAGGIAGRGGETGRCPAPRRRPFALGAGKTLAHRTTS